MKHIDNKILNISDDIRQLTNKLKMLEAEKANLITEKHLAKNKPRTKEQDELITLRESIKSLVDSFNSKAIQYGIEVGVGLLTTGGYNIYALDEDNCSENGEYFNDAEYENHYAKYGENKNFWFPSSMDC